MYSWHVGKDFRQARQRITDGQGKGGSFYTHELVDIEMPVHYSITNEGKSSQTMNGTGIVEASERKGDVQKEGSSGAPRPGASTFSVGELIDAVNAKQPGKIPGTSRAVCIPAWATRLPSVGLPTLPGCAARGVGGGVVYGVTRSTAAHRQVSEAANVPR